VTRYRFAGAGLSLACSAGGDGGRRSLEHDDLERWCGGNSDRPAAPSTKRCSACRPPRTVFANLEAVPFREQITCGRFASKLHHACAWHVGKSEKAIGRDHLPKGLPLRYKLRIRPPAHRPAALYGNGYGNRHAQKHAPERGKAAPRAPTTRGTRTGVGKQIGRCANERD
jgi:hypothetical protein